MTLARRLLLAFWAGLLVTIGGVVAPTLFRVLGDRHLAGVVAGELFRIATLSSVVVAVLFVALGPRPAIGRFGERGLAALAAGLLAASEWLVRPLLEAARAGGGPGSAAFAAWHGVSSLLYLGATVAVVAALVAELRR